MNSGPFITVSVNLDLITNPQKMENSPWAQARKFPVGNGDFHWGIKVTRWGGAKTGNQKNAKWRQRRGGAHCSPINKKFKTGI